MKKLTMTLLTILSCGAAYALPVGNPGDASLLTNGIIWSGNCNTDVCDPCFNWFDAFSVRLGFYGDYVFNRHLEFSRVNGEAFKAQVELGRFNTNAGLVVLNFFNRVDLFTTLGTTHISGETTDVGFSAGFLERLKVDASTDFSWSVGGRATLWEMGCTMLGIEGQYFRVEPRVTRVEFGDFAATYPSAEFTYSEWQVGLGLAHRINMFVPYAAVKYSHADLESDAAMARLRNAKHWGYAVGLTMLTCDAASLTAEARFADEKALHVNAQFRF